MKFKVLDGKRLKEITSKNSTAEIVALMLSIRERNRSNVSIDHVKRTLIDQGEPIADEYYLQYWKDLEAAGMGRIIYGRRGKAKLFAFNYDMRAVGTSCINGTDEKALEIKTMNNPTRNIVRNTNRNYEVKDDTVRRRPFRLSVEIPEDAGEERLFRLINALKSI